MLAIQSKVNPGRLLPALAWRISFRLVGWSPAVCSSLAVAIGLVLTSPIGPNGGNPTIFVQIVAAFVPLALGVQAALLFSPDSEPSLELLLVYSRPVVWVLIERLVIVTALAAGIALSGNLVGWFALGYETLPQAILRWLSPCIFLMGMGIFGTQMSRQGIYGTLLVTLMWGGMLFGGDALLARWPYFWPIHLYIRSEIVPIGNYVANRIILILAGLILTGVACCLISDEERLLSISTRAA